jgi:hypothetical protein
LAEFQDEIKTSSTLVRSYDNLFTEIFFASEILGDTQKVLGRPIDLVDRGNVSFRKKRRSEAQQKTGSQKFANFLHWPKEKELLFLGLLG